MNINKTLQFWCYLSTLKELQFEALLGGEF